MRGAEGDSKDRNREVAMEDFEEREPCRVCGKPSDYYYQDREDCPWCGGLRCGIEIQAGLDFVEDHP